MIFCMWIGASLFMFSNDETRALNVTQQQEITASTLAPYTDKPVATAMIECHRAANEWKGITS